MAVDGRVVAQNIPEPAAGLLALHGFGAGIGAGFQRRKDGVAGIAFLELGAAYFLFGLAKFGQDDMGLFAIKGGEHAVLVVFQEQYAGEGEGRNFRQLGAVHHLAFQAGAFGRAQAGAHAHLFGTGKARHEELRGNMLALQAYEHGKAVQKRRHEVDFCRGKGLYSYFLGIVHLASLRRMWAWAITKEYFCL